MLKIRDCNAHHTRERTRKWENKMNPYEIHFTKAIQKRYPDHVSDIVSQLNFHYNDIAQDTRFALTSNNPIDKRLEFSSCFLALIKTLDQRGESFETIRATSLEVVTDYVQPKTNMQAFFKRLTPTLINTWLGRALVKSLSKKVRMNQHPDGFVARIITDKQATYGFGYGVDILECGICKLFNKHNYQKYASILCEVDEITSGLAGLQLIRTGTIANGAKKCDFRFKKIA
jgi:hypothetical protein